LLFYKLTSTSSTTVNGGVISLQGSSRKAAIDSSLFSFYGAKKGTGRALNLVCLQIDYI
jgi:hypothetical protein